MESGLVGAAIWVVVIAAVAILFARQRRRRGRVGSAAASGVYDWLNQEKRNAVEIIVEERAAARDPEDRDGNLPDLAKTRRP